MSYTDVSIDLETLGTKAGSVITQIGLCAFDQRPGNTAKSSTNIFVAPQSMLDLGFTIDWSTIAWWLTQSDAARTTMAMQKGRPIKEALAAVNTFFAEHAPQHTADNRLRPWGNGASFDIGLLEVAYSRCGMTPPWDFRKVRDLRTLADISTPNPVLRPSPDVEHVAMDDAIAQADWIQRLTRAIETREVRRVVEQPQGLPYTDQASYLAWARRGERDGD